MEQRSCAPTLDRGGLRRTWRRGREDVHKRYLVHVAASNLGLILRALLGAGTPRELAARGGVLVWLIDPEAGAAILLILVPNARQTPLRQRAVNEFRDIITHRAPISHLGPHDRVELRVGRIDAELSMSRVVFKVPDDPFEPKRGSFCDALELFHQYYGKLMEFADFLIAYSPYEPLHRTFNETNMSNIQVSLVKDIV